jgi:carbonic anhydrase
VSATDEYLAGNARFAKQFRPPPARSVRAAILACMDARLNVYAALGLADGDAHVLRNAGGQVTDDLIRSLAISQRLLGTREIMLIHHTECGMLTCTDQQFVDEIHKESGITPSWAPGFFTDLADDVRRSMDLIRASPFIPHRDSIRGFIFDVATGELTEVS